MGLCKCPKKKVTNLFCFEHRVNVCEDCIVSEHTCCIVQSYLQWLNDSDYNPICLLCSDKLITGECLRLLCYDVFHKTCLNEWAGTFPQNTAPAGYKCPTCSEQLFPASHVKSPIAEALRQALSVFSWARAGLGLPLLDSTSNGSLHVGDVTTNNVLPNHNSVKSISRGEGDGAPCVTPPVHNSYIPAVADSLPSIPQHRSDPSGNRRTSDSHILSLDEVDADAHKYKRRSAWDWVGRLLRTMGRPSSRHHQGFLGGRRRMMFLLLTLGAVTVLVLMSYFGRMSSQNDPNLDPLLNPNLHFGD